ncbi:unnamed protein product [Brassicogethes aeneus]|uniref:Protein kinase domain-containing protein n=1 Tax=Brassicogethes aeneus TaxID=1431903 RepID=A0A9P0FJE4_BRAAE|nr:unnamed protein product [Brassicogethes aeneus]
MDKKDEVHIYLNNKSMEYNRRNDYSMSRDKNDCNSSKEHNITGHSFRSEFNSSQRRFQSSEKKPPFTGKFNRINIAKLLSNLDTPDSEEEEEDEEEPLEEKTSSKEEPNEKLEKTDSEEELNEIESNEIGFHTATHTKRQPIGKENINHEDKQNINESYHKRVEDSFELDFSALSLITPKKKKQEPVLVTPDIPKICITRPQHEFVTPQLKAPKIQFSAKKEMLHPQNSVIKRPSVPPTITETPITIPTVKTENTNDRNIITVRNVEYQVLNKIGKGGSSEVFHCFCGQTGQNYAIKCVSLIDPATTQGYLNEVKILSKLQNCDKIINMKDYEHLVEEKKLLVVLEKGGEDLSTILKHLALRKSHISMHTLLFYWMEMLLAVKEIHQHGIIHSDLKPANFIQAGGGIKLIDFGIASCVQTDMTSVIKSSAEGSCNYISPESIRSESSSNLSSPNYGKKFKDNCGSWNRLIPLLKKDVGFLTIDLPGHGLSSKLPHGVYYHDASKPMVNKNNNVRISKAIDAFLKYSQYEMDPAEPPSYTLEELTAKICAPNMNSVMKEHAHNLYERVIAPSKKSPGKFYFTRDVRLKSGGLMNFPQHEILESTEAMKFPIFIAKAPNSPYYEPKENFYEVLEVLRKSSRDCDFRYIDGTHHFHLNSPELVSDFLNDFIERNNVEDRGQGGIKKEMILEKNIRAKMENN